jgi:hypothetical protein
LIERKTNRTQTFEKWFLQHKVVDVEPSGESGVVVGEADIT